MKKYAGYCRVSILKQKQSIEQQKATIQKYCKAYDMRVTFFIDDALSAYTKRPAFEKMLESLDKYDGVITSEITRIGRDTIDLLGTIRKIESAGKSFIMIKQQIDTSTKEGKLLLGVLSIIADYERVTIRERLEAGKEWAKIHGTKSGKPMHRPRKEIDWRVFDEYKRDGLNISRIAKKMKVSTATLYNRIEEIKQ